MPTPHSGWCSWYYYYKDISGAAIHRNLKAANTFSESLPLELFQIDDGFQSRVGDWLSYNQKFPEGVAPLAEEIKSYNFIPGLWLAPFILHPNSRTAKEHPDWLLKTKNGRLARAGFVWNSLGAALDLTVPEAMDYVSTVIDTAVNQWGFPYLKLDFLYAAALKCRYRDDRYTRAQVLRRGMEIVRKAAGSDTFLLGCGAPLGSVLGFVQAMRISADVSGNWEPAFFGVSFPFRDEPHMPSARNSIQNILTRAPLHNKWWVNDPDCLLVRSDSQLSLTEVRSLATAIALTGGSVLLSDDMTQLPKERIKLAASLLPPINQRAEVLDWIDENTPRKLRLDLKSAVGNWSLLAFFNWMDNETGVKINFSDFHLINEILCVRSFWDNKCSIAKRENGLFSGIILAHGAVLLAVRDFDEHKNQYLGSSFHVSQGHEISSWHTSDDSVQFTLNPGKKTSGYLDLFLIDAPIRAVMDRRPIKWQPLNSGIYRFFIPDVRQTDIKISIKNNPA